MRALYLASAVTDAYVETGDERLLAATVGQWDDMTSAKMYLTGGVGSRERDEAFTQPYDLPPDHAYCETCAAIASMMWNWRLLLATGDARYADLFERTLYNGFLSGVSDDGETFFYVNPLHAREAHTRQRWYEVACCPPNVMRILSSLEQYIATTNERGVQIHQYIQGTIRTRLPGASTPVDLRVETGYPWADAIDLTLTQVPPEPFTLSLRVPAWCDEAALVLNGQPLELQAERGQLHVIRAWAVGDRLRLTLARPPRVTAPDPRIDAIRGCLAVERGPIVYCVEARDLPAGTELTDLTLDARRRAGTREPPRSSRRDGAADQGSPRAARPAQLALRIQRPARGAGARARSDRDSLPRVGQPRARPDARLDACRGPRRGSCAGRRLSA